MNVTGSILDAKHKLDEQDSPQDGRFCRLPPAHLYTLCNELQLTMVIQSSGYRELENCKRALVNQNWDIARVAMPSELFGMRLELEA